MAAAIFYSLTSHPKPGAFDRVVQALIFTVIGQAIVALLLVIDSSAKTDNQWLKNWEPALSVLIAVILGNEQSEEMAHGQRTDASAEQTGKAE